MIIPLLLATANPDYYLLPPPTPSWHICEEMAHDIQQAVEFEIINQEQADKILLRCLVNYSTGPNDHYQVDPEKVL